MFKIDNIQLVKMITNCDFKEGQLINVLYDNSNIGKLMVKQCGTEQYLIDCDDNEEALSSYLTTEGFEFEILQ